MSKDSTQPLQASTRSFNHFDTFPEELQTWLQQTADVDLISSEGDCIACHASSLVQWSSVWASCIEGTIPSKEIGHVQAMDPHRIPVDGTASILTSMLRILYSSNNWKLINILFLDSREHFMEVLQTAHKLDAGHLLERMEVEMCDRLVVKRIAAGTEQMHVEHAIDCVGPSTDLHINSVASWCMVILERQKEAVAKSERLEKIPSKLMVELFKAAVLKRVESIKSIEFQFDSP